MAAVDSPITYPESPMDQEDIVYPCKGCGEILEEGKAFELAGNRWHIDCFRCHTCGTLLDTDANLLLLGDGSLICNNCTYSCNACGNKIEDLAILTGDQAFCSGCFRCRNCKRKIENLRYARTSQGIFCMSCHESVLARRRKRARTPKTSNPSTNGSMTEKALPSLPPGAAGTPTAFSPDTESLSESVSETHTPTTRSPRIETGPSHLRHGGPVGSGSTDYSRDISPQADQARKDGPLLPSSTYDARSPNLSHEVDFDDAESGFLPMAFDPTPITSPASQQMPRKPATHGREASPQTHKENLPPRDYFGPDGRLVAGPSGREDVSSRSASTERDAERVAPNQSMSSPHIISQEKSRHRKRDVPASGSSTPNSVAGVSLSGPSVFPERSQSIKITSKTQQPQQQPPGADGIPLTAADGGFKLREVPKSKKAGVRVAPKVDGTSSNSMSPSADSPDDIGMQTPRSESLDSQHSGVNPFDDPRRREGATAPPFSPVPPKSQDRALPLRGDSLPQPNAGAVAQLPAGFPVPPSQTPVIATSPAKPQHQHNNTASAASAPVDGPSPAAKDNSRTITIEVPPARTSFDAIPPRSASRPTAGSKPLLNDDFIAPRAPPLPPPPPPSALSPSALSPLEKHRAHESISTMLSDERRSIDGLNSPGVRSAGLPKYVSEGAFTMEDELVRIIKGQNDKKDDASNPTSVLRRVSNAVKHGRSFSDRGLAASGKSSINTTVLEISSPIGASGLSSPTVLDNVHDSLRTSLRRAQLHITELEAEKLALVEKLNGSSEISAVNTELSEKRSTMAFLDTQREMVVRELEIMTDHLSKAKDGTTPLDLASLKTNVMKEFAESLQKLKDQMGAQIEDLIRKRNELTDEIGNLIQMKDKGFQEYESLSSKNVQLQQHNSELLRGIQGMYQDNRGVTHPVSGSANGLGIYNNTLGKPDMAATSEMRKLSLVSTNASSQPTLVNEHEAETAPVLATPQVVNIRKEGKPTKFNWRRGGEKMAKNVTKGIKTAFVGDRPGTGPGGQPYAIGVPYSQTAPASAGPGSDFSSSLPKQDESKAGSGFGIFGGAKNPPNGAGGLKIGAPMGSLKNNSNTNVDAPDGSVLFGSELMARCEFEGRVIPSMVTRCIQEVEWRGMEVEGIYRKSGGAGQVKSVQQGFDRDPNHDISDPDLDIHAVTSALKQYFRKLPTPLIAFAVYDNFLEAAQLSTPAQQIAALRAAVADLPEAHRDCLQFLMQHLARVMAQEPVNLMTPLNLAVVFAPTIMRPESIEKEMTDMLPQRQAVQALLEHYQEIFALDE